MIFRWLKGSFYKWIFYTLGDFGPPGRAGAAGKDGEPGLQAWKVNVNDHNPNDILIPPSIVGKQNLIQKRIENNILLSVE